MPQQTMNGGVNVQCLINPNIAINGLVEIDQASIYRAALSNADVARLGGRLSEQETEGAGGYGVRKLEGKHELNPGDIAADGVYIVKAIGYHGDTRGQEWYMNLLCLARGAREFLRRTTLNKYQQEK